MNVGVIHGFDWDEGNWPKCGKHGVTKAEIESLFGNRPSLYLDPNHSDSEQRYRAIGSGVSNRYILVAFTFRNQNANRYLRPISARYMHQKEVDFYAGK